MSSDDIYNQWYADEHDTSLDDECEFDSFDDAPSEI
jgi:hypothetical protein